MKLSHDPNNTKWTNDTSSFGLKIMTSQGWQPGQYLGAKDAAHAEFHTAANASHIRVAIKDDNLGLGAKIGTGVGHGECTGLDAFKNLLGRLNGKDEDEIIKEQQSRDDLRRAIYSERKWGTQRFVSGGFLIGDKIQILIDAEAERIRKLALGENEDSSSDSSSASDSEEEAAPIEKTKKSKKRKLEVLEEAEPEVVAFKVKKSKKSKARKNQDPVEEESAPSEDEKATKKSKKSKKDRKPKGEVEDTEEEKRKKEKKEKKERKRQEKAVEETDETEKEKRRREKKEKREKKKAAEEDTPEVSESSLPTTKESTPLATPSSGRSTPMMQGRHAVRSRYIAQKRLASMDAASLNQIFMIKSQ
ncbi:telomerase inhibitor, variant 2 [Cadophora gregata]|nr:telomerase inhibitor, variant 2 [Cadophora gregata]KAK0126626.1 telomerase inhibitor, variant 2 [Cadophora gregata]